MAIDCSYLQQKITDLKALIDEYEAASLALATNKIQQFTFDTGQTTETVKSMDVDKLDAVIDSLYNRLAVMCARCPGGGGVIIARPAW